MVTITDQYLRTNVWETIYDLVDSGTYTSSVTPTVTNAFISNDHKAFPQIVINPVDKNDVDGKTIGSDRRTSNKEINVIIEVYTKKAKDIDTLSDEIDFLITGTNFDGITNTDYNESYGQTFPNEQKLHIKTMTYTFIRR